MTLVATLAEFKKHLNRADTDTTDDTELTFFLTAATQWFEYAVGGPIDTASFTERHWVSGPTIVPRKRPIVAVTSITPDQSTALSSSSYFADAGLHIVQFRYGWVEGWNSLVYTAGLAGTVTDRQKLAGLEVARHLWLVQNGSSGRGFPADDVIATPLGFAVPRRAAELLQPDTIPGIG